MQTPPTSPSESVVATGGAPVTTAVPCPILAAAKARAKALKKLRKHEMKRLVMGWCSGLHALGFSF